MLIEPDDAQRRVAGEQEAALRDEGVDAAAWYNSSEYIKDDFYM